MKIRHLFTAVFASLFCASLANAQNYAVSQVGMFTPQKKKVLLLEDATNQKKIILFQT